MKDRRKRLRARPTRNSWLNAVYEAGLVRADEYSCALADKLFFGRELEKYLGKRAFDFYPKTRGLREMMALGDLRSTLAREFPRGYIVKPVAEVNSGGETPGFYFAEDDFFADLDLVLTGADSPHLDLLRSAVGDSEWVSPALGRAITGERLIFQSDLGAELMGEVTKASRQFDEVRTHTFEGHVIYGGDYHRWSIHPVDARQKFEWAVEFTQSFLSALPAEMVAGQAWSLDLLVGSSFEQIRVIDVNTNRGKPGHWSGFLVRPQLIGAYTRHFERTKDVRFDGWNGFLLRKGLASYHKYLKKRYIEGIT